jgi:hypothetical protein
MFESVYWAGEDARNHDGDLEKVTVVLWDYEAKEGKAMVKGRRLVDVYLTDYAVGDLTIGVRNAHPSLSVDELRAMRQEMVKVGHRVQREMHPLEVAGVLISIYRESELDIDRRALSYALLVVLERSAQLGSEGVS